MSLANSMNGNPTRMLVELRARGRKQVRNGAQLDVGELDETASHDDEVSFHCF